MVFENLFCIVLLWIISRSLDIQRIKNQTLKKINISVLSHSTFYLEDDDHKRVDFINETISFTCHLVKI